jgi:hypothetical protein
MEYWKNGILGGPKIENRLNPILAVATYYADA